MVDQATRENLPRWDGRRGRYEAWFVTLSAPEAGYWIRYTLHSGPRGPVEPRLWFARFDRRDPSATFGVNVAVPHDALYLAPESFGVVMGGATLGPTRAAGSVAGAGHEARWDLEWTSEASPPLRLLPPALYRRGMAPTRLYTPAPDARFRGTIEVDGEPVVLEDAPGQQGHVEGTRHADRWAWASCTAFDRPGYAVQALSAQGRRGPVVLPFVSSVGVRIDDRWIRLGSVARSRTWALGMWRVRLAGKRHRLEGEVSVPREALMRARYVDPDGTPRWCHNSEVASSRLRLWERGPGGWGEIADLVSDGTTHAEWAGRTPAPGHFAEHIEA